MTDRPARPYRLLITASRTWENVPLITRELSRVLREHPGAVLVSGHCPKGGDAIAERCWAWLCGHVSVEEAIDAGRIEIYPIDRYRRYGRGAGPERNKAMVRTRPDEIIAFMMRCRGGKCYRPDAHYSHGAAGCYDFAVESGIPASLFTQETVS